MNTQPPPECALSDTPVVTSKVWHLPGCGRLVVLVAVAALPAAQSTHALLATAKSMAALPAECEGFTDEPIAIGMSVKRDHIVELRDCIAALRAEWQEPVFDWGGDIVAQVTEVKAQHLTDLRAALAPVFVKTGVAAPQYSAVTQFVAPIQAVHINELRSAIESLNLPRASVPEFSPAPGTYGVEQSIALSTSTGGATIRYTLDGSTPWSTATVYNGPIAVHAPTTIHARAFKSGMLPSAVASGSYHVCPVSVSPTSFAASVVGDTRQISVTAPDGCNWIASSNSAFITIEGATSGFGNGAVTVVVAGNLTGVPRSGSVSIAGASTAITQNSVSLSSSGIVLNWDADVRHASPTLIAAYGTTFAPSQGGGQFYDPECNCNISWEYTEVAVFVELKDPDGIVAFSNGDFDPLVANVQRSQFPHANGVWTWKTTHQIRGEFYEQLEPGSPPRYIGPGAVVTFIRTQTVNVQPPTLRLFLDSNNTFEADRENDLAWWVPGSHRNGLSKDLPTASEPIEKVRIIAAYVNAAGSVMSPPSPGTAVQFSLPGVSQFRGIAMNWADPRGPTEGPDFLLSAGNAHFTSPSNIAFVELHVWDYGGVGSVHATHAGQSAEPLRLPRDLDEDLVPDAGWYATGSGALVDVLGLGLPEDDNDASRPNTPPSSGPPNIGLTGDGLSRVEEYRGFVMMNQHRRTNPGVKDLFASSAVVYDGVPVGLEFASLNLVSVHVHRIIGEDEALIPEHGGSRVVNAMHENQGTFGGAIPHSPQRALRINEGSTPGYFGATIVPAGELGCNNGGRTPNEVIIILIDEAPHAEHSGSAHEKAHEIRRTVAHEIGHGIHITHRPPTQPPPPSTPCNDGADVGDPPEAFVSVMSSVWTGAGSTDPSSQYNGLDLAQIRLKIPR